MAHDLLYWLATRLECEEGIYIYIGRNIPNFLYLLILEDLIIEDLCEVLHS